MIELAHVARSFGPREVLCDVHLSIARETVLIVGSTGAGKSLLVRLLCGLDRPTRGSIVIDGLALATASPASLAAHRRRIALWPQRPELIEQRTVIQNVALALEVAQWPAGRAWEQAGLALQRAGCGELADRCVETLSIGERRLVSLARALAREDAALLIADEPAAGLDAVEQGRIGALLAEQGRRGTTVVVTSQERRLAGLREARVGCLERGRVDWSGLPTSGLPDA